jgi:peptidoglycan/LPS O-acetylase OafA/YrhL
MSVKPDNRISELDALRGIAAVMVVFFHYTKGNPKSFYEITIGVTGVDLFFIISGFVILLTLERTKSARHFIVSRLSRLYPTYWACLLITTISLRPFGIHVHLSKLIINTTMVQRVFNENNVDPSYWTMYIEMLFYILMLLVFMVGLLKRIEIIGAILLLPVLIYNFLPMLMPRVYSFIHDYIPLVAHLPLFISGIVFYKIKFNKLTIARLLLLLTCFAIQIALYDNGGYSWKYIEISRYVVMLCIYYALFGLYVTNRLTFMVNRVTVFFGTISYSLYLIHQYIGTKILIPHLNKLLSFQPALFISFLIITLLAYLINKFIEKPSASYLKKRLLTNKANL